MFQRCRQHSSFFWVNNWHKNCWSLFSRYLERKCFVLKDATFVRKFMNLAKQRLHCAFKLIFSTKNCQSLFCIWNTCVQHRKMLHIIEVLAEVNEYRGYGDNFLWYVSYSAIKLCLPRNTFEKDICTPKNYFLISA